MESRMEITRLKQNIQNTVLSNNLTGGQKYSANAIKKIKNLTNSNHVYLTHTCTSALELITLIENFDKEDEIIIPAYTFVSSVNPFVLRGCKIVFVAIFKS